MTAADEAKYRVMVVIDGQPTFLGPYKSREFAVSKGHKHVYLAQRRGHVASFKLQLACWLDLDMSSEELNP